MNSTISSPEERYSRFTFNKRDIRKGMINHERLMPDPGTDELSVFETSQLSKERIESIGTELARQRGLERNLHGRADIRQTHITHHKLWFDLDDDPSYHGNIRSWPMEDAKRINIAQDLSRKARLHLYR